MSKLKRYEVRWIVGKDHDAIEAFRLIGSDEVFVDFEYDPDSSRYKYEILDDEHERFILGLFRGKGSLRAWLIENEATPWYNGPGDLWSCLLDEDQAMAFKMRWL